jgi:tRNA uridine 5-carbamoylmethylation protein Kti12
MAEHAAPVAVDVISSILADHVRRVIEKALRGEKLSDWEVGYLLIDSIERRLSARIDAVEKSLSTRIATVEKTLAELRTDLDKKITEVKNDLDKKISEVKDDTKYLKWSLDQLRDNVINVLVKELISRKS